VQNTDIPLKLPLPFGAAAGGGYIRTIPVVSQIGVVDGAASLTDGFVPLNATPIGAGGIPPDIKDMNGILYEISGWSRWVAAGGPVYFDGTFATAIGGYPLGATIQSAVTPGVMFVSTANNNATNPDSGGADWISLTPVPATLAELIAGTSTVKYVTPATLAGLRADTAAVIAGTDAARYITPASLASIRASGLEVRTGTDTAKYITPAALAGSNSPGVLYAPGGSIIQDGFVANSGSEGGYTTPFNTPFPNEVRTVILTPVLNSAASNTDWGVDWQFDTTNLTTLGYYLNRINDVGTRLRGISWVAFGR